MTVKTAVDAMEFDVYALSRKKTSETVSIVEAKSATDRGLADSPLKCMSKNNCFGSRSSADSIGYGSTQKMSHICVSVDQA